MAYMQFSKDDDLEMLLPRIADRYDEEFCVVPDGFDADFIETLVWHGYFPMAASFGHGHCIMLAKIHLKRCVLELADLHVPKKVKQRSSKFQVTMNTAWQQVLAGINEHHEECWLYDPLVAALKKLFDEKAHRKVKMHTVEVWSGDKLVAGDLGYSLGGIYTSLSGFFDKNFPSSGSIQCCVLGRLLSQKGFFLWDLGMQMEYKSKMGAYELRREGWLQRLLSLRERRCDELVCSRADCSTVLNSSVSPAVSQAKWQLELQQLASMGFLDPETLIALLENHKGEIEAVIEVLTRPVVEPSERSEETETKLSKNSMKKQMKQAQRAAKKKIKQRSNSVEMSEAPGSAAVTSSGGGGGGSSQ